MKKVIWTLAAILVLFLAAELALVFFVARSTDTRISRNLYKAVHPGQLFSEAVSLEFNPTGTTTPATTSSNQPVPGTCLILEEQYCNSGKIVKYDKQAYVGLSLPTSTVIFSPFDNVVTFGVGVGLPGHLLQGVVVLKGNNINTSPGFVAVGNGLVYLQTSSFNKSGNAVNPHVFGKGDVVTTLQTDDRVPGLSDNVLIRFASPDKTIDALFASEVAKVQSGQETVDQLIQNMVEAEIDK